MLRIYNSIGTNEIYLSIRACMGDRKEKIFINTGEERICVPDV
jgi:hypothetical protein